MFVLVPEPVCITPSGNSLAWRPSAISSAAAAIAEASGCPLDERDGADQLGRHDLPANPEIVQGALRLGAPKRVRGDANFAEAVLFDAVLCAHG
jgi:hypothetical protein